MTTRDRAMPSLGLRPILGALAWLALAGSLPAHALNSGGSQEANPFAPKPPQPRALPSILERDANGRVVRLQGDPGRAALKVLDLKAEQRRTLDRIMAERDRLLRQAAVLNADKIIDALEVAREGRELETDAMGVALMASLGEYGRRGQFATDSVVRAEIDRPVYIDLTAVVREYNFARIEEEREAMLAEVDVEEVSEVLLRDSTILQRLIQRDAMEDAARMLEEEFGGAVALVEAHPELGIKVSQDGYWPAMSELSDEQLTAFVRAQTGVEVSFPSPPEGARAAAAESMGEQPVGPPVEAAQEGGNAGAVEQERPRRQRISAQTDVQPDADGKFRFTDEELEVLRVQPGDGPSILERGPDGKAVRLDDPGFVEAYELLRSHGAISEADIETLDRLLADRDAVFDEQALRLYEFLLVAAGHGPVEDAPLEQAVIDEDWRLAGLMFGAWLNEKLPAPSTFHNDQRIRNGIEWDTLIELARIANEYDGGHIFDARIELLKMVRDNDEMNDASVALPGNIKRPWRLQQIIKDAKASYARQLRVTEPDFRGVLAGLDVSDDVAKELEPVVAMDGPMTVADFWDVAVKLPPEAHRQLIEARTGYEAPEPGFFEGKYPTPTTGADG
ncbi:MAG: hypothetical protein RIE77_11945 [Phycisphaerales bacterium]|jgi:hypothetical protein